MKRLTPQHHATPHAPRGQTPAEWLAHYMEGDPPLLEDGYVGLYVYLEYRLKKPAEFAPADLARELGMDTAELLEMMGRLAAVELISLDEDPAEALRAHRAARPLRVKVEKPLSAAGLRRRRSEFWRRIRGEALDSASLPDRR